MPFKYVKYNMIHPSLFELEVLKICKFVETFLDCVREAFIILRIKSVLKYLSKNFPIFALFVSLPTTLLEQKRNIFPLFAYTNFLSNPFFV